MNKPRTPKSLLAYSSLCFAIGVAACNVIEALRPFVGPL